MTVLKELKKRINTVKSTKKITRAMKMVAASKLRKATVTLDKGKIYHHALEESLMQLISSSGLSKNNLLLMTGKKNIPKHLYIIGGSERGLCGGFNTSLVKFLNKKIINNNQYSIICLSSKIYSLLKAKHERNIIDVMEGLFAKEVHYNDVKDIVEKIITNFNNNEFGSCSIIYNKFSSIISQVVTEQSLIPIKIEKSFKDFKSFESEPTTELVLEELLKKSIEGEIYYALLENAVSEHGARMNAMDNATRNADRMIKDLTLQYNRSRQANITKELIEIISGSEAL